MSNEPVIVECIYNAPVTLVWDALTNNDKVKKWYFQLDEFKPEIGFKFDFTGGHDEGPQYLHLCEITESVINEKITYSWRYDNYPGNSEVTWELFEQEGQTRIKLTHTGLETFEENGKDFTKESFTGGWKYFLNDALKKFLEQ